MSVAHAARAGAAPARDRATVLDHAEIAFVFVSMLLMSQALLTPLFAGHEPVEGPLWMRMMWFPIYGGTVLFAAARASRLGSAWPAAVLTLPLILLAFVSSEWSLLPDVSTRRAVALTFTTLFGLYLAVRFGWRELAELLATVFLVLALGSYVAVILFPSFGVDTDVHPGAWKGLWLEKNALGAAMVRGALACACAAVLAPPRRLLWIGGAVLCAGLVLASTSATSLIGLLVGFAAIMAVRLARSGGLGLVAMIWLGLVAGCVVAGTLTLAPEFVLQLLGKDPTLTGRTDIWEAVLRRVAAEPGGHGYAAFWTAEQGPSLYIQEEAQWEVPNAHNGWLELLLWFGWAGVWLFAAHYLVTLAAAVVRLRAPDGGAYLALPTVLLFALFSVSESTIMQWNNLSWVLYVAILAKLLQVSTEPLRRTSAAP